jgi:hypothetical protein
MDGNRRRISAELRVSSPYRDDPLAASRRIVRLERENETLRWAVFGLFLFALALAAVVAWGVSPPWKH